MNWFKKSYNRGIPLMDDYTDGIIPPSGEYRKDPRSLVTPAPEFGGNKRKGYPRNTSSIDDGLSDSEKLRELPGENVLMDQDPPTGEGINDDRFVSQDEFNTDNDKLPIDPNDESVRLDKGPVGPHNMPKGNIFNRLKQHTKVKGLRF